MKVFSTIAEALWALQGDKLGCVYHRAKEVFVTTAHGTGTFPREEWIRAVDAAARGSTPPPQAGPQTPTGGSDPSPEGRSG